MNPTYTTSTGKEVVLEKLVGKGGEGEVWTLPGGGEVAKIYHPQILRPEHEQKLSAMLANPPRDEMRAKGHVSIAWPSTLLYRRGRFAGFLMPMLAQSPTILSLYNPKKRRQVCPGFNWKYLLHTALNLSTAVDAIHAKNYIIGDINESNILVKPSALVSFIDTDSFQVTTASGRVYPCLVGKPEFTPPELSQGGSNPRVLRPEHDNFGLAVLIFQLLMEGHYPFAGVMRSGLDLAEPAMFYCLKQGAFPYAPNPLVSPPPTAPRFDALPPQVQKLLRRCFLDGHRHPPARPSPDEWVHTLETAERRLALCRSNPEHYYSAHLSRCPWCEYEAQKSTVRLQTALPPAELARGSAPGQRPSRTPSSSATARRASSAPVQRSSKPPTPVSPPSKAISTHPVGQTSWLPTGSLRAAPSRARRAGRHLVRALLHTPTSLPDWSAWRLETFTFMLLGGAGGFALYLLLLLVWSFPIETGYFLGVITAGLVILPALLIARYLMNHAGASLPYRITRSVAIAILFVGGALAFSQGGLVADLSGKALAARQPNPAWLFVNSLLVSMTIGAALGSFRAFARRRKKALAIAVSLAVLALPLAAMWAAGMFGMVWR